MVRTNARRKLKQRKRPKQADQGAEAVLALKVSRCRCVNCTDVGNSHTYRTQIPHKLHTDYERIIVSKGGGRYKDAHIKNRRGYWVGFIKESTWGRGGWWTATARMPRSTFAWATGRLPAIAERGTRKEADFEGEWALSFPSGQGPVPRGLPESWLYSLIIPIEAGG